MLKVVFYGEKKSYLQTVSQVDFENSKNVANDIDDDNSTKFSILFVSLSREMFFTFFLADKFGKIKLCNLFLFFLCNLQDLLSV